VTQEHWQGSPRALSTCHPPCLLRVTSWEAPASTQVELTTVTQPQAHCCIYMHDIIYRGRRCMPRSPAPAQRRGVIDRCSIRPSRRTSRGTARPSLACRRRHRIKRLPCLHHGGMALGLASKLALRKCECGVQIVRPVEFRERASKAALGQAPGAACLRAARPQAPARCPAGGQGSGVGARACTSCATWRSALPPPPATAPKLSTWSPACASPQTMSGR